jgi:hypothetical protein
MPEPIDQIQRTLTSRNERKELLVLACEVDRMSWRQACQPVHRPGGQLALTLLNFLQPLSSLLPGRLGRWLRGAGFLAGLGRQFGWLRR